MSNNEKARENRMRRLAKKQRFAIKKSRIKHTNLDDFGEYRIINTCLNSIEAGERFDMSLEAVEKFLKQKL